MHKFIFTENAPKPLGPYSQAILANDTMLFLSGQIAVDAKTNEFIGGDIEAQTAKVIENISEVLKGAGFDCCDVVKTTCFLKNMDDFAAFNELYQNYFLSNPARSCVAVAKLPKDALIEMEVIAFKNLPYSY